MATPADPATKVRDGRYALLSRIPSVDELLLRPRLVELSAQAGRNLVLETTRGVVQELRESLVRAEVSEKDGARAIEGQNIETSVVLRVTRTLSPSLRRVINATGVILHTNLGRAPLAEGVLEQWRVTATHYANLEYDLEVGARGKRDTHVAALLTQLTGAEAAIVVNNNAAAVLLVLNTLAKGAEVPVSRGELIEIGDGFRIPEIMAESGALLREVGTTNRTRIADYERAINEGTRLLLRVHPSNFRMVGFTERPTLEELVALGRRRNLPVFEDLGSGCLADMAAAGIIEPHVRQSLQAGASLVSFSGDKLLGGPQAGIITGQRELVERVRKNPLFRALRVDKLTIAALEVTLRAYLRGALDEIPALRMMRIPAEELAARAAAFAEELGRALPKDATVKTLPGFSVIGGGSTPDQQLPAHLVAISSRRWSATELEERLRQPENGVAVIARIEENQLLVDLRTVRADEESELAAAVRAAVR